MLFGEVVSDGLVRLLIVVLLAMFSPTLAQAQECSGGPAAWISDSRTGCNVWSICPQIGDTVSWSGACAGGRGQGRGTMQWLTQGTPSRRYEGEVRAGKKNGRGVFVDHQGTRYDGEWREGLRSGQGVTVFANGDRYEGNYRDDKATGRGVLIFANGNTYEGDFLAGVMSGRGIFSFAKGDRYDGEWKNGTPDGYGTATVGGEIYKGTWNNGCFRQGNRMAMIGMTRDECGFR